MDLHDFHSQGKISSSLGYKLVPWVNWDEWNYVRRSIFSSSPILVSAGLQKISAWESRGRLPVAVDLTAVIIEIHQKDPFFRGDGSIGDALVSEKMLNMLYCMFIMKLVNDFVEPIHKETGRSISDLADAVGIPRTLVDIRHESSHRCLPSLKLARSAIVKALEWLKVNYWEPQRLAVHDPRSKVKSKLREMSLCLTSNHVSSVNFAVPRRKCCKRATLLVARHKLSYKNKRLLASKSNDWNRFLSSQNHVEIEKVCHLRSLLPFLIRNLKALKESRQIGLVEENQFLSTDNIAAPKVILSNLLHKCLTLLVPGDKHLSKSVLLLSEMSRNRLLTDKLKKLPVLAFLDQDLDPLATSSYNDSMLLKEEDSIKKAEERLNHIKLRLLNGKIRDSRHLSCNADASTRWTVTKSWVACPIGMLPCSFSSTAVIPTLDVMEVGRENDKTEKTSHGVENVCSADRNEMVCDDNEPSDDGNPVKKLKQTPQNESLLAPENPFPMQGRLLIGGVWKKVSEEELVSLEADVRTFA